MGIWPAFHRAQLSMGPREFKLGTTQLGWFANSFQVVKLMEGMEKLKVDSIFQKSSENRRNLSGPNSLDIHCSYIILGMFSGIN